MLTRLYVDNYGCLTNFELRLTPTTLLCGDNGAGKSMVLEVLYCVRALLQGGSTAALFPDSSRTRWSSRTAQTIELDAVLDDRLFKYRLEIEHDRDKPRVALEELIDQDGAIVRVADGVLTMRNTGPLDVGWKDSGLARFGEADSSPARPFIEFVRRMIICSALPPKMRADADDEAEILDRDGENFVAWYRYLSNERQDALAGLSVALREIIEGLRGLRLASSGKDARTLTASFVAPERFELSFDELSDGQRMLIVLYSLLHLTADQGYSLWLDEPANFLALKEIQPWIIALSDLCGGEIPQATLCSHHPELIDYLGPQDGLLLQRRGGGPTTVRPLRDVASTDGLSISQTLARGWEA